MDPEPTTSMYNTTEEDDLVVTDLQRAMYIAYNTIAVTIVVIIMFSMGCGISPSLAKPYFRRPIGPAIGMFSQFIILPCLCFGMANLFQMEPHLAIGIVFIGSSPGGANSNMFTYWMRGDLPLSMTMTVCSCILALPMMPLNTFMYTRQWQEGANAVPYGAMAAGVVLTWIPVILGMLVRYKFLSFAKIAMKVGSATGFILILINGFVQGYAYPEVYSLDWTIWFAAVLTPLVGMGLGFFLSWIPCFHQEFKQRKTIAIETGMQNSGLALAMIALSFPAREASINSQFPLLYTGISIAESVIFTYFTNLYYRIREQRTICHQFKYRKEKKKLAKTAADPYSSSNDLVSVELSNCRGSYHDFVTLDPSELGQNGINKYTVDTKQDEFPQDTDHGGIVIDVKGSDRVPNGGTS